MHNLKVSKMKQIVILGHVRHWSDRNDVL